MRIPALFIGHGSPMNAIQDTAYSDTWASIGKSIPQPSGIVVVSAHWYVSHQQVTSMKRPETIHDFGRGFPQLLFDQQYPAPGSPELAQQIHDLIKDVSDVELSDASWGLDHGSWSVLLRMFPKANIPVVQLSIMRNQPNLYHFELGKRLAPLRDQGILILTSGSLVHNLGDSRGFGVDYGYAPVFNNFVKENINFVGKPEEHPLVNWDKHPLARKAHPSPEHYLPLLYLLGLKHAAPTEKTQLFLTDDYDGEAISMLSVQIG